MKTDEELFKAYAEGDYPAFETLYRRHSGRIHAYLRRRLSRSEEVDEVFQKIFLRLHRSRHRYDGNFPALSWLFVVARTVLIDHLRGLKRRPEDLKCDPDFAAEIPAMEAPEKTELPSLDHLPAGQRAALEFRYFDELTFAEIAKRLDQSEAGARQLVSRAVRALRTRWVGENL